MKRNWIMDLDEVGQTPLSRASKSGNYELPTLMLLKDADDEPRDFRHLPTIHRAACWGFADVLEELIADGADPDERDVQQETPLHKAVRLDNLDAARTLLEHRADVNAADALGLRPLHWAALTGSLPMTELLLSHHADVAARDYYAGGLTPEAIARMLGHTSVIELIKNRFALF